MTKVRNALRETLVTRKVKLRRTRGPERSKKSHRNIIDCPEGQGDHSLCSVGSHPSIARGGGAWLLMQSRSARAPEEQGHCRERGERDSISLGRLSSPHGLLLESHSDGPSPHVGWSRRTRPAFDLFHCHRCQGWNFNDLLSLAGRDDCSPLLQRPAAVVGWGASKRSSPDCCLLQVQGTCRRMSSRFRTSAAETNSCCFSAEPPSAAPFAARAARGPCCSFAAAAGGTTRFLKTFPSHLSCAS